MPPPSALTWVTRLTGTASVAGQTLKAEVFLQDTTPAVWAFDVIPPLKLSALFDQFFGSAALGSAGLTWPSEIVDLTLTDSTIFYVVTPQFPALPDLPPAVLAQKANVSGPGLFVATTISLTLAGKTLEMLANLSALPNKGFMVAGQLNDPINFLDADFLFITAPGSSQAGPSLLIQSFDPPSGGTSSQFSLNCGFKLFGLSFPQSSLTVSTDSDGNPTNLAASLVYDGKLGPWTNPELDFTWSSGDGFRIQNLPRFHLPNLPLDFARLLQQATQINCNAVVSLALKKGLDIETNFTLTPSLGLADDEIVVTIKGSYRIGVQNTGFRFNLPELPLSLGLPSAFTFDGIADQIGKTIVRNGEAVLQALWNDKAALALLLGLILTKEAMNAMIAELANTACSELSAELEVIEEAYDAVPPSPTPSPTPGSGGGGGGAGGAGANVGGLIGAGIAGLKKAGDLGSSLGHDLSSGLGSLGSVFGDDDGGRPLEPPATINVTYSAKPSAVVVEWIADPIPGYDVQLTDSTGQVLWRTTLQGSFDFLDSDLTDSVSIAIDPQPPVTGFSPIAGVYTLMVRAGLFFTTTSWTKATIVKLAPPTNVVMSCNSTGEEVTARWTAVASATEYAVVLQDADTNAVVASQIFSGAESAGGTLAQTFRAGALGTQAAASYIASVQSLAGDAAIPSDTAVATPLAKLAAPASVNQSVIPGTLRVSWTPVANQTTYLVRVFNQSTSTEALNLPVTGPTIEPSGLIERDLGFDQFKVKSPGQYVTSVSVLGDSTHIASNPTVSSTFDVLFSGIGDTQIGTTFMVS